MPAWRIAEAAIAERKEATLNRLAFVLAVVFVVLVGGEVAVAESPIDAFRSLVEKNVRRLDTLTKKPPVRKPVMRSVASKGAAVTPVKTTASPTPASATITRGAAKPRKDRFPAASSSALEPSASAGAIVPRVPPEFPSPGERGPP